MINNISPQHIDKAIELNQHTRETNHKEKYTKCITLYYNKKCLQMAEKRSKTIYTQILKILFYQNIIINNAQMKEHMKRIFKKKEIFMDIQVCIYHQ